MGSGQKTDVQIDGLIARALSETGYDVLNAGVGELLSGPTGLRELSKGAPALVSANGAFAAPSSAGKDAPSGILKPYVVREVDGRRVALVGVTAGGVGPYGSVKSTEPPVDALKAVLPEVRSKADLVVVLADVDVSSVPDLADESLGVDVLLGARSTAEREPAFIGKTLVANAGGLTRHADRLTITLAPDGRITSFDYEEVAVDESVRPDEGIAQLLETYEG